MGQNTWIKHTGLDSYLHGKQFINIKMNNIGEHYPYLAQNNWITKMLTRDPHINEALYHKELLFPPPPLSLFPLSPLPFCFFSYLKQKIYSLSSIRPFQTQRVSTVSTLFWKEKKGGDAILHIILGQIWFQPCPVSVIISILKFFTHNWFFTNL